ncbi:hypothetical protein Lal_00023627 [Lupinus albus]|nr:hypothetical protein Lal_00023627 [Lupinus albus]
MVKSWAILEDSRLSESFLAWARNGILGLLRLDFGSSNVASFDSSNVANFGSSNVANFGSSNVANFGSSNVANFGSSNVASFGSSNVANFGSSYVAWFSKVKQKDNKSRGKPLGYDLGRYKGSAVASFCNPCSRSAEDDDHLFLHCCLANNLWHWLSSTFSINLDLASVHSIFSCTKQIANKQVKDALVAGIIHTISTIWFCRSSTKLLGLLKSFGWIKANTDGAALGSPGISGGDGIFRYHNELVLACFSTYLEVQNALFVELHSAFKAIDMAFDKGWSNLWLECDSMQFQCPLEVTKCLNKVQKEVSLYEFMHLSHLYRQGNACAYKLASFGIVNRRNSFWNHLPNFLKDVYHRKRLGLPNYRFRNL